VEIKVLEKPAASIFTSSLNMEAAGLPETLITTYKTI
jgi:hypothetical protein